MVLNIFARKTRVLLALWKEKGREGSFNVLNSSMNSHTLATWEMVSDSKSFQNLSEAEPPIYPGKSIENLECVGHIQKRMGQKLNNLVLECKKKSYTSHDGKNAKGLEEKIN